MELLINLANILYILSYFIQDLLRIRWLTVCAAVILVAYFYLQPEPMMTVIYWNLFFIALNVFQITRIVLERRNGCDPLQPLIQVLIRIRSKYLPRSNRFSPRRQFSTGWLP